MANNLTFLANDMYPGRKIMVWAHNFHIRHDNTATTSRQPTMGKWQRLDVSVDVSARMGRKLLPDDSA